MPLHGTLRFRTTHPDSLSLLSLRPPVPDASETSLLLRPSYPLFAVTTTSIITPSSIISSSTFRSSQHYLLLFAVADSSSVTELPSSLEQPRLSHHQLPILSTCRSNIFTSSSRARTSLFDSARRRRSRWPKDRSFLGLGLMHRRERFEAESSVHAISYFHFL